MSEIEPTTIEEHIAVVDSVRAEAEAIPAENVREPEIPVEVFLDENRAMTLGATQHADALSNVGFNGEILTTHQQRLRALSSAQRLWNTERRSGYTEEFAAIIDNAETTRDELVAAAALALRHDNEGMRRIALIREGEGVPDLIADLDDVALLVTEYADAFIAIKQDPQALSQQAAKAAEALKAGRSEQQVSKSLSGYKEIRDRIYTLCKESLTEIRAFAAFAFRKDRTNARRFIFTSAYVRKRNRKSRRNAEAVAEDSAQIGS